MKIFRAFSYGIFLLPSSLLLFLTIADQNLSLADERQAVPSEEDLKAVQEEVEEFYKAEFQAARSTSSKKLLAKQLLEDASEATDDSLAKYTLLRKAQELSSETKYLKLGVEIADALADSFLVSQSSARAEAITMHVNAKGKFERPQYLLLANESLSLIDPLLDEGDFDLAKTVAGYAANAARKVRDFVLFRKSKGVEKDIDSLIKEEQACKKANKALQDGVGDDPVKTMKGKFECFVLGNWQEGLEMLSKGSDPDLKELAEQTQVAMTSSNFSGLLADRWWEISEDYSGRRERVIKRFAAKAYESALDQLVGFQEKRAKSRIAAVERLLDHGRPEKENEGTSDQQQKTDDLTISNEKRVKRKQQIEVGQKYTVSGQVQLGDQEIEAFLMQCERSKRNVLDAMKRSMNSGSSNETPEEVVQKRKVFAFVSQKNVLIMPRSRVQSGPPSLGKIFKPSGPYSLGYAEKRPYCDAKTIEIIDGQRAYVLLAGRGPVILQGIDTSKMPKGNWECYFLLKRLKDTKVPSVIGEKEVLTYGAISVDEFPAEIILW